MDGEPECQGEPQPVRDFSGEGAVSRAWYLGYILISEYTPMLLCSQYQGIVMDTTLPRLMSYMGHPWIFYPVVDTRFLDFKLAAPLF